MRLVHSFSAIRCTHETLPVHVFTFTLSAVYAKLSGFEIVLHTDKVGAYYLQHAPYDKIITDLGEPPVDGRVFAWCKFKAMDNEPIDSIHIDGDVFIKKSTMKNILHYNDCDVICQNLEKIGIFPYHESCWDKESYSWGNCSYPKWMPRNFNEMYNCGIIGFKDISVRKEYHNNYKKMMDDYKINGKGNDCVPELVSEQKMLYDFCKHKNLKVKCILDVQNLTASANKIGYQHLLGNSKYKSLNKTKQMLKTLNSSVYEKTVEILSVIDTTKAL